MSENLWNKIPISDSDLSESSDSESFSELDLINHAGEHRTSNSRVFECSFVQQITPFLIVNLAFFWSYLTGQIEDQF